MSSRHRVAEKGSQISNPNNVLYPAGNFTKGDVVSYYERVARFLLPHFRNGPVTLKRYPNGVFGEAFTKRMRRTSLRDGSKHFRFRAVKAPGYQLHLNQRRSDTEMGGEHGGPGTASVSSLRTADRTADTCRL